MSTLTSQPVHFPLYYVRMELSDLCTAEYVMSCFSAESPMFADSTVFISTSGA